MKACSDYHQTMGALRTRREAMGGMARLFLAGLATSAVPGWRPSVAFGAPAATDARDVLVCVFLRGGADGLSIVGPYGDDHYYTNRPTIAIPAPSSSATRKGIDLDGFFALHPSLSNLKPFYDAGSLAIVHASGSIDPTRSHFDAQRFMEQATPGDRGAFTGWIARHLGSIAAQTSSPLRAIGFGGLIQASLRGVPGVDPIAIGNFSDFGLAVEPTEADGVNLALKAMYGTSVPANLLAKEAGLAFQTMAQIAGLNASNYQPANGAQYPANSDFAVGLMQTAVLLKANQSQNLGLEAACIDMGDWDTHESTGTIGGYLDRQLAEFGNTLAAFLTDLGPLVNNITLVTMSEFGRRVQENASHGTDHGHGNVMFIAGGGVNGGLVYGGQQTAGDIRGAWPTLADDHLDDGDLTITVDQRDILSELVAKRLADSDLSAVFPNYTPVNRGLFKALT